LWAFGCILYELLKGESINCDVEDDEEVQKKIYKKLGKQCPDDLLKNILVVDPSRRLSIEEILSHKYFEEYRGEDRWVIEGENRRHLKKFLKGNYNLADPRTLIDALNMDLIGMKASE
jgi:serine/threonine protein kinase